MSEETQPGTFTWEDVQAQINSANETLRAELKESHDREMDVLRQQALAGAAAVTIPEHSAGAGTKVEPTWSLAEQTAAREAAHAKT